METCKHELPRERCAICTAPAKVVSAAKSKKQTTDVVIVAAGVGYPEYLKYSAYVGHPNRPFRDGMRWMAFYADGEIKPEIPEILHLEEAVSFTAAEAARRRSMSDDVNRRVGDLIETLLEETIRNDGEEFSVVLLSAPDDVRTLQLPHAIVSDKRDYAGKRTAVTAGQYRYVKLEDLEKGPETTSALSL
jgi:hypothetical protein